MSEAQSQYVAAVEELIAVARRVAEAEQRARRELRTDGAKIMVIRNLLNSWMHGQRADQSDEEQRDHAANALEQIANVLGVAIVSPEGGG